MEEKCVVELGLRDYGEFNGGNRGGQGWVECYVLIPRYRQGELELREVGSHLLEWPHCGRPQMPGRS